MVANDARGEQRATLRRAVLSCPLCGDDEILAEFGLRAEVGDNQHRGSENISPPPKTTADIASEVGLSERVAQLRKQAADLPEPVRDAREARIFSLWLRCHTQEQIAEDVGMSDAAVRAELGDTADLEALPNLRKLAALYQLIAGRGSTPEPLPTRTTRNSMDSSADKVDNTHEWLKLARAIGATVGAPAP